MGKSGLPFLDVPHVAAELVPDVGLDLRLFFAYPVIVLNVRPCRVSFTDTEGITHTAEVSAGSFFEAAALGIAAFRRCGMMDTVPGPATQLTVTVAPPTTSHEIPMRNLLAWLAGNGKSPAEQAVKVRLREILDGPKAR